MKGTSFNENIYREFIPFILLGSHPNIIKLKGHTMINSNISLVLELAEQGSLENKMDKISDETKMKIIIGMCSALD